MFSWPGDGIWPDRSDIAASAGVDSSEYAYNTVFPDLTASDRYGNDVSLYQFYGSVVLLDFSAGWCGACKVVAEEAGPLWEEHRDAGFVVLHLMIDDWNNDEPDADFLGDWADEFGLDFPVLGMGDIDSVYYDLYTAGLNEGYIPYMLLLDSEMQLHEIYVGSGLEGTLTDRMETLLPEG